jgi:hypothetical protein
MAQPLDRPLVTPMGLQSIPSMYPERSTNPSPPDNITYGQAKPFQMMRPVSTCLGFQTHVDAGMATSTGTKCLKAVAPNEKDTHMHIEVGML